MSASPDEQLLALATATADAAAEALEQFAPGEVEIGEASVVPPATPPLDGINVPAVAAEVVYHGPAGGTLFVTTVAGVRKLAAAIMGNEATSSAQPLDERERSAVGEAMNQMMTAAATATAQVVGRPVDISEAEVRDVDTIGDAFRVGEGSAHSTSVVITMFGEPCRFVQLVPTSFVATLTGSTDGVDEVEFDDLAEDPGLAGPSEILRGVKLRVCAEIGRATMPAADAVSLPPGGLVELDRGPEEAVDVLVNGRLFATGRIVLVDDEWAVRIEEVLGDAADLANA
jgi:flagellar motor switch protein FliN